MNPDGSMIFRPLSAKRWNYRARTPESKPLQYGSDDPNDPMIHDPYQNRRVHISDLRFDHVVNLFPNAHVADVQMVQLNKFLQQGVLRALYEHWQAHPSSFRPPKGKGRSATPRGDRPASRPRIGPATGLQPQQPADEPPTRPGMTQEAFNEFFEAERQTPKPAAKVVARATEEPD